MRRLGPVGAAIALVLLVTWKPAAAQQRGGRGGGRGMRTRKAVLAWSDTRNGIAQHDSVSYAPAVIERLGYESGAYDIFIRTDSVVRGEGPRTGVPFTPRRA